MHTNDSGEGADARLSDDQAPVEGAPEGTGECTVCGCSGFLNTQDGNDCINFKPGTIIRCGHSKSVHK